jgi:hypothetical protein
MKYFDSFIEFVATVQRYQDYLKGCFRCGFTWCSKDSLCEHQLSEEAVEEIQRCVVDLSNLRLTVQQLESRKIKISHGLCTSCLKESLTPIYRKRQREEGNPDCFGKAQGFCDRFDCDKRSLCVHNKLPENWEKNNAHKHVTVH